MSFGALSPVATQDPSRQRALVVPDKLDRVANFHASTILSFAELTAAAGLDHPREFRPEHFLRRVSGNEVLMFSELYPPLESGELLRGTQDHRFQAAWNVASSSDFRPILKPEPREMRATGTMGYTKTPKS